MRARRASPDKRSRLETPRIQERVRSGLVRLQEADHSQELGRRIHPQRGALEPDWVAAHKTDCPRMPGRLVEHSILIIIEGQHQGVGEDGFVYWSYIEEREESLQVSASPHAAHRSARQVMDRRQRRCPQECFKVISLHVDEQGGSCADVRPPIQQNIQNHVGVE